MNRQLAFWIALLLIFSGTMLIVSVSRRGDKQSAGVSPEQASGTTSMTTPRMSEFELIDQTGSRFNSKEMAGKVWLGSFFFVSCPATCYQQNMKLQQLYAKYADQGLKLVSISCDPDNDTPVALAGYAARFNALPQDWKFLTTLDGDRTYLQKIGNEYLGISVDAHQVTHSDRVVIFDRDNSIKGSYRVLIPNDYNALDAELAKLLTAAEPASSVEPADASLESDASTPLPTETSAG